jgi:hypothetical protein
MKRIEQKQVGIGAKDAAIKGGDGQTRADAIERARRLLADPSYPDINVARHLARNLIEVLND